MEHNGQDATDPRRAGGDIAGGTGDPHERGGVVLDLTNAVLLDHSTVSLVDAIRGGQSQGPVLAVMLQGRINKTDDRARILYLMNEDGAAALVSELIALASRIGPDFHERFMVRVDELIEQGAV